MLRVSVWASRWFEVGGAHLKNSVSCNFHEPITIGLNKNLNDSYGVVYSCCQVCVCVVNS